MTLRPSTESQVCVLSFPVDGKERECEVGREKKDNNEEKYKDKDNDKEDFKYI